jgi:hypothetical protein
MLANTLPNHAASVDAPMTFLLAVVRHGRRATEQPR